jgi:hypothetical protein
LQTANALQPERPDYCVPSIEVDGSQKRSSQSGKLADRFEVAAVGIVA